MSSLPAISSFVGVRPSSCCNDSRVRRTRFNIVCMWTGNRIVREWLAIDLKTACWIHLHNFMNENLEKKEHHEQWEK
jgi:hypothetical protein